MKTAIVEDHLLMRDLLKKVCVEFVGFPVVAEAADGYEAVELIALTRPELILLDLVLPEVDGFAVLSRIRSFANYRPRILMLSGYLDAYSVHRIIQAGVDGFVDKRASLVSTIREAILAVAANGHFFSETFNRMRVQQRQDPNAFDKILTRQERIVLILIGDLLPDDKIALQLKISTRTLETHRLTIKRKLGLSNRTDLVQYAVTNGFVKSSRL